MKLAVVGATGLVGREILEVLGEFNLDITELIPVASSRRADRKIHFKGKDIPVTDIENAISGSPDLAIFSAGSDVSLTYAPRFAAKGTVVIDNSSAWRMEEDVPLIVPEINGKMLEPIHRIIANPNCSTIQLVMVLWPLQVRYGIKRVVVSTYQAVTGSGKKGLEQLENERSGIIDEKYYPYSIDLNVIPQAGSFEEGGYTTEEVKLVNESRKILGLPELKLTATAVRVPVTGGHSEAVNVELKNPFIEEEIANLLSASEGIIVTDDPENSEYPMPLFARRKNDVFVGRIRRDYSVDHGLNLWVVSDNLRKGAATNAVQIAKYLVDNKILF
jgi:aspartate-semialdehyde dehydrogenase